MLERININPEIFGGKPIIRGRRLAVEHVLAMLASGDSTETILEGYPWLEQDDVLITQPKRGDPRPPLFVQPLTKTTPPAPAAPSGPPDARHPRVP
jgi:hypothetical protein